jgi:hypothetical protein
MSVLDDHECAVDKSDGVIVIFAVMVETASISQCTGLGCNVIPRIASSFTVSRSILLQHDWELYSHSVYLSFSGSKSLLERMCRHLATCCVRGFGT